MTKRLRRADARRAAPRLSAASPFPPGTGRPVRTGHAYLAAFLSAALLLLALYAAPASASPEDNSLIVALERFPPGFNPAVASFHFGLPAPELLARVKATGAKVFASATTVAEAKWLARHGADAIIAQGLEAGGHRGHFLNQDLSLQQGTFTLLPQIVAAVDLPVIAAGGIVDGKGIKAALALGASAVQMGTAFLCCHEATTSPLHRAALLGAQSTGAAG